MSERVMGTTVADGGGRGRGLDPRRRAREFIGQQQLRDNLAVFIAARAAAATPSITCCCTARPASARPRWRRSWRASWASASA